MATATTRELLKARMGRFFGAHGRFCASHPWEVIATIVTLTVCVLSMGVLNGSRMGICGIHRPCENEPEGEDVSFEGFQMAFHFMSTFRLHSICFFPSLGSRQCVAVHCEQSGCHLCLQPV